MKATGKRPKSSKAAVDILNPDVPVSLEKHPSEINILSLNRKNVQQYLLREKQKKLQSQFVQEEFLIKKNENINEQYLTSPGGASSVRSGNDNKKEAVQVFVRVRPAFTNEVEEEMNTYMYPTPLDANEHPLWSCV